MSDKEMAKKAFELAQKEAQEKELQFIKSIIQKYLEDISKLTKDKREIEKKLAVLKADIDDFKAVRLDKVKERQDKDPVAKEISPIIIKIIEKEYQPLYPWYSPWQIEWKHQPLLNYTVFTAGTSNLALGTDAVTTTNSVLTGNTCSSFTHGTYIVGNQVVNL